VCANRDKKRADYRHDTKTQFTVVGFERWATFFKPKQLKFLLLLKQKYWLYIIRRYPTLDVSRQ